MYKVGRDAGKAPKMQVYFSEDAELLMGLPKIFWICLGIVSSFLFVELLHMMQV